VYQVHRPLFTGCPQGRAKFTDLSLQIPIAGAKFTDLSLHITPYKEDGKNIFFLSFGTLLNNQALKLFIYNSGL
jgi:hypothetical protein